MLRKELIRRKISLIQDDLEKLTELSGFTLKQILSDYLKQATVERLLERIVSRAIDINEHIISRSDVPGISSPRNYKETFMMLAEIGIYKKDFADQISKSVGTRNLLVHEYDRIDYKKVYKSIKHCLKDYHMYIQYLLKFLKKF